MIKTMFNGGINGSWDFMAMFAQDAENLREILNAWVDIISDENEKISIDHWNFWDMEE